MPTFKVVWLRGRGLGTRYLPALALSLISSCRTTGWGCLGWREASSRSAFQHTINLVKATQARPTKPGSGDTLGEDKVEGNAEVWSVPCTS